MAEPARPLPDTAQTGPAATSSGTVAPPPLVAGQPPATPSVHDFGLWSGFEGREELLAGVWCSCSKRSSLTRPTSIT